ncbi:MAG: hypothetical protein M3Y48_22185 [Actinomycetota bacterium]|nr:hypothetical protein [Actinomycetota bacterium]
MPGRKDDVVEPWPVDNAEVRDQGPVSPQRDVRVRHVRAAAAGLRSGSRSPSIRAYVGSRVSR